MTYYIVPFTYLPDVLWMTQNYVTKGKQHMALIAINRGVGMRNVTDALKWSNS